MTTFVFDGFTGDLTDSTDIQPLERTGLRVLPTGESAYLSYTVTGQTADGLNMVNLASNANTVSLGEISVLGDVADLDVRVLQIDWDGGNKSSFVLDLTDTDTGTTYTFQIGGDRFPLPRDPAALEAFRASITSISNPVADSGFAPADMIPVEAFPFPSVTENDILVGTDGVDELRGGVGDDIINGLGGDDRLFGNSGNDIINGGPGADYMKGGNGSDTYYIDDIGDQVIEERYRDGTDRIYTPFSINLAGIAVEELVLTGSDDTTAIGNGLMDHITGNSGDNLIDGGPNADWMAGGRGNDTYIVRDAGDQIVEYTNGGTDTVRAYVETTLSSQVEILELQGTEALNGFGNSSHNKIIGNNADNKLFGKDGNDTLKGQGGADVLNGGSGADVMNGGEGGDTYVVDHYGDRVIEDASWSGVDHVKSTISFSLQGSHIENLSLIGNNYYTSGTGNALDNVIRGNDRNNALNGKEGADIMRGGKGNDTYYVDNIGDVVYEVAGGGNDSLHTVFSTALPKYFENLYLLDGAVWGTGSNQNNRISGNNADNRLEGRGGQDYLWGHNGNDELLGGDGNDDLNGGNGDDILGGGSGNDYLSGDNGNDQLNGGAGNDRLYGNNGDDILDGGTGNDIMYGGRGNDIYFLRDAGDRVYESYWDGPGTDVVYASVDVTTANVRSYIEKIVLTGTDDLNIQIYGSRQELRGNAGDNILDGNGGGDTMLGGLGNDTYVVHNKRDVVIEGANAGEDTIQSYTSFALSAHVEKGVLLGASKINLIGNTLDNALTGNTGDNTLNGREGNDTLRGNAGADSFVFDRNLDAASNVDRIIDFAPGEDKLVLKGAVFGGLTQAELEAGGFALRANAADADERIIYHQPTGQMWYDADGSGAAEKVLFATFANNAVITVDDFSVV